MAFFQLLLMGKYCKNAHGTPCFHLHLCYNVALLFSLGWKYAHHVEGNPSCRGEWNCVLSLAVKEGLSLFCKKIKFFFMKLVTCRPFFSSIKCKDDAGGIDDNIFFKGIFMGFLAFAKGITIVIGRATPVGALVSVAATVGGSIIGKAIVKKIMK